MVSLETPVCDFGLHAIDFSLPGVDGNTWSLQSCRGEKGLLVMFICNHCPYVKAIRDRIVRDTRELKALGINTVAIMSNDPNEYEEDSFENMKKRAEEQKFNFLYLQDEDQSVAKAFDATHTPEIFLFDSERKLVYSGKIDDNWQVPEKAVNHYLRNAIDELLGGKEISVPETYSIGCTIKWKN
ncbi:MAG: thioredoxin family protein [Gammaproteobacteria bacterium]|nr:thioredoxin family protein [Gammaproteobacteria bacterium]